MNRWPLNRSLLTVHPIEHLKANGSNVLRFIPAVNMSSGRVHEELAKTAVLMLHHGQPRTPYYATKYLAEGSHYYYKLPLWLTSKYSKIIQEYLNELIPEHRPFYCTHAFLYDDPAVPKTITDLIRRGMERLILLPLYPHYSCFRTGTMLNIAVKALDEQTKPLSKDGISLMDHRVRTMSHVSFRCSTIDRWSNHPAVINRGYNSSGYIREVWTTCHRLMEHLNEALPWKLAWFSGWDQWPATTLESIKLQLYLFRRDRRYRTLVVPIASLIPSFESESLLPNILQNEGVDLLSPPPFSPVLAHGFAELIKNHLMGRRASSQLSCRCKFCFSSLCLLREAMLTPKEICANGPLFLADPSVVKYTSACAAKARKIYCLEKQLRDSRRHIGTLPAATANTTNRRERLDGGRLFVYRLTWVGAWRGRRAVCQSVCGRRAAGGGHYMCRAGARVDEQSTRGSQLRGHRSI
uniref:Uncharacterized protein n=1 Tax=Setaria digitata TaxID=48799 RepID=A0A915PJD6_9BILA